MTTILMTIKTVPMSTTLTIDKTNLIFNEIKATVMTMTMTMTMTNDNDN